MALYELEHPLGQDIEKLHQAFIAGLADNVDLFGEDKLLRFHDALSNESGISVLKMANWATKKQLFMEFPMVVPKSDQSWQVDWGTGVEPVLYRFKVFDMLGRKFELLFRDDDTDKPLIAQYLSFAVTKSGVALVIPQGNESDTLYGEYESAAYDRFATIASMEASIGELAILADAT
jgi:hypothetical protein